MAGPVHVGNVEALDDMQRALGAAQLHGAEALTAFKHGLDAQLDRFADLEEQARKEVWRAESELESARDSLRDAETTYDDEDPPDTSPYEEEVDDAEHRLGQAEEHLAEVARCAARIRDASEAFSAQAVRFESLLDGRVDAARSYLTAKHQELTRYLSLTKPGGVLRSAVTAGSSIAAGVPSAASGGTFRNLGIIAVALGDIDLSSINVHGPQDFRKVSYEEMLVGVERFDREVRPAVEGGATKEYFEKQDTASGVDYERGLTRLYDAFYGTEAIRLERVDGRHIPVNGEHRLFIARQLGLSSLPASVAAKENS
jgi:hypothetical protein